MPPLPSVKEIAKEGWMDSIHFDHHLENDPWPKGLPVYATEDICRKAHPCIDTDGYCTALKVAILKWEDWLKIVADPPANAPEKAPEKEGKE